MNPDKKQRIMQAAEKMFKSRQLHQVTLEEVAREADVGKGTLYLYFADKEDLFFQTALAGFDEMCALLQPDAIDSTDFLGGLRQMSGTISEFFRARRPLFRMIQTEGDRALGCKNSLRQRWRQRRKKMTEAVAAIIARGRAAGHIRGDVPCEILAEYFLGMIRTRAWELEDQPEPLRNDAALVDFFINGATGQSG